MRRCFVALVLLAPGLGCPAEPEIGYKPIDTIGLWCDGEYEDGECETESDEPEVPPADSNDADDAPAFPKPDVGTDPPVP